LACDQSGNLYAGGNISTAGGLTVTNIAKWDGANWSPLGSGIDGGVYSLACDQSGNLYAGGNFTLAGEAIAANIAKWNGTNWSALGSGLNALVLCFAFDLSGNLFAGGRFSTAGTNVSTLIAEALLSKSSYNLSLANLGGGTNLITGLGTPGYTYALEFATNLVPPIVWTLQMTNSSSSQTLVFTNISSSSQGFYRMRYMPQ
jgi:hypothetical protein